MNKTNPNHREGTVATKLEQQTAKIPSDTFLWASISSMVASLTLRIIGKSKWAVFVGQWAPSFLILGLYNKIVKELGHD
ncbi:MAG: hypothetical protein KY428_12240 [Bacteroidetes bacterium]|nr:hypothetical protein [Bacteroidota bacterium]